MDACVNAFVMCHQFKAVTSHFVWKWKERHKFRKETLARECVFAMGLLTSAFHDTAAAIRRGWPWPRGLGSRSRGCVGVGCTAFLGVVVEMANIVFACHTLVLLGMNDRGRITVATSSNILESIRLTILLLNDLSEILCTVMHLASLIDTRSTAHTVSASTAGETAQLSLSAWLPVTAQPRQGAYCRTSRC